VGYPALVVSNASLAEALFQLSDSHPPGDLRLALLRAAYAIFDHPREVGGPRRLPQAIPLEVWGTVAMLRTAAGDDALAAVTERLAGPVRPRIRHTRDGFLSAAAAAALLAGTPALDVRRLRGVAHWHTRASDGIVSLDAMARACLRRGARWAVVSDHTRSLECVNGLDGEGAAIQRRAVVAWNRRHGDELALVQGLEVEVDSTGALELPRDKRGGILVIAGIHSSLQERGDQTSRFLRVLEEPGVWALAHPRGRLFNRRSGVRANWEIVFRAAASAGVLMEINGFPRRQDLDPTMIALARDAGCRFLLASDAHHPRHLEFDGTAVALAIAAGLSPESVVNFASLDGFAALRPDLDLV